MSNLGRLFRIYKNGTDPIGNSVEHAMFMSAKDPPDAINMLDSYGNNLFELFPTTSKEYPRAESLNKDIYKALGRSYRSGEMPYEMRGILQEGNGSARKIANEFNPTEIVDSAGAYDNPTMFDWFWDHVAEKKGLKGVLTNDGAVAFDRDNISHLAAKDALGNWPENISSFWPALLGVGAAGSIFGSSDAQAATHTHADANNLDRTIERLSKSMPLNDMASGMIPRATQASVQPINNMGAWQQMEQQGRVTPDLPVPEAEWSPVDLATAPIGAAGKVGKLAAMALDAPINLAVNRLIDALSAGANTASNWWNGK